MTDGKESPRMFSTDITRETIIIQNVFKSPKQLVAFKILKTGIILSDHTIFND